MPTDSGSARPRRSPAPDERQQDGERSRRCLLAAALDEFSAKGFAGARVQEIADRAGLNKQLINYYFGGKAGLYRELQREWLRNEATFVDQDQPIADLAPHYLHAVLTDPRSARLQLWRGLAGDGEQPPDVDDREDLDRLAERQARGEIAPELDAACVMLAIMSAVVAPVAMPQLARKVGLDPSEPEFEARYGEALRRLIRRLGAGQPESTGDAAHKAAGDRADNTADSADEPADRPAEDRAEKQRR